MSQSQQIPALTDLKRACFWPAALLLGWSLAAAPGDILVTVQDMKGHPLAAASGVVVTLLGVDETGCLTVGTQTPDGAGQVVFSAETIATATEGAFHFVVESVVAGLDVRASLCDPFGLGNTYIAYQPSATYEFKLPTPISGRAAPQVLWAGAESQLRFSIDLGDMETSDLWFVRPVWQRKASTLDMAGTEFGLLPVVPADWLAENNYLVEDGGLDPGQTGNVRFAKGAYDQTFLARKESVSGESTHAYRIYLINCLWNHALPTAYDPATKTCSITFDPTTVFGDPAAPAWEGQAMKDRVPYFISLQAQAWFWHEAGASEGLAIDWGSGAAPSVFHPVRINDQNIRLEVISMAGHECRVRVHGNAGLRYTVEYASAVAEPTSWLPMLPLSPDVSPFEFIDTAAPKTGRLYRVRQP